MQIFNKQIKNMLAVGLLLTVPQVATANSKTLDYDIIEAKSTSKCQFIGETRLHVRFSFKQKSRFTVQGLNQDNQPVELFRKELTAGRGATRVTFDAGRCVNDLTITATIEE